MQSQQTPTAFHTVAQGRRSTGAPWDGDQTTHIYAEGVIQNDSHDWLYNAFGVNDGFGFYTQGARLDKLAATLGYGV